MELERAGLAVRRVDPDAVARASRGARSRQVVDEPAPRRVRGDVDRAPCRRGARRGSSRPPRRARAPAGPGSRARARRPDDRRSAAAPAANGESIAKHADVALRRRPRHSASTVAVAEIGGRQHGDLRALGAAAPAPCAADASAGPAPARRPRRSGIAHDPLAVAGVEEERACAPARSRAARAAPAGPVPRATGGISGTARPAARAGAASPARARSATRAPPAARRGRPAGDGSRRPRAAAAAGRRTTRASPRAEKRDGEDADELALEVVGLVDDRAGAGGEAARRASGAAWRSTRCWCRRSAPSSAAALARAYGQPARRDRAGAGTSRARWAPARRVALADVVVAALHQLQLGAELALVLVLEQLLRGQQVGVAAPARERHGDVALADAGRRLDQRTRAARRGSSSASASASASAASRRACSGRGVAPAGKCASRSVVVATGRTTSNRHVRPRLDRSDGQVSWERMADRQASPRLEFSAGGLVVDEDGPRAAHPRPRPAQPAGVDAAEGRADGRRVEQRTPPCARCARRPATAASWCAS